MDTTPLVFLMEYFMVQDPQTVHVAGSGNYLGIHCTSCGTEFGLLVYYHGHTSQ